MKFTTLITAVILTVSTAFANHHEEKDKKKMGHDKEHAHVKSDKMDHEHDEGHHKDHDHKAHHPEHKDQKPEDKKEEKKKK